MAKKLDMLKVVESFQCAGCTCGSSPKDGCFEKEPKDDSCGKHSAGTFMFPGGNFNAGLPKGFNKFGPIDKTIQHSNIRIFQNSTEVKGYNKFNVPVWAMEHEQDKIEVLLVRVHCPRTNVSFVDVIVGGKLAELKESFPAVIDVAEFIDDIN